jgi:hypothetical protein
MLNITQIVCLKIECLFELWYAQRALFQPLTSRLEEFHR